MLHESRRLLPYAAIVAALTACPSDTASNPFAEAMAQTAPASASQALVALKVGGGSGNRVDAYTLPALNAVDDRLSLPPSSSYQTIGFTPDDGLVYLRSGDGMLVAIELASGRARRIDSLVAAAVVTPTGIPIVVRSDSSVGAVNNRRLVPWSVKLPSLPSQMWGALGDGLLIIFQEDGETKLAKVTPDWDRSSFAIPSGITQASTWGDLVVVATDSGVVGVDPEIPRVTHFRRSSDAFTAMTLSPSGHRIYAATASGSLVIINRFDFSVLANRPLPGPVSAIRHDPWGRYLLYRPVGADSIWVASVEEPEQVQSSPGRWSANLPTVAADGTVLVERETGVVALDGMTDRILGSVDGKPGPSWIVVPWNPQRQQVRLVEETGDEGDEPSGLQYYAQVSSTSNADWARDEVNRLVQAGIPAVLLPQTEWDDRYRVGLGPFPTRQAAEESGRVLGRAFFVISINPSDSTGMR